nr:reverse transcriptase domain-containing protein [Tanacetum cinerariifolium]
MMMMMMRIILPDHMCDVPFHDNSPPLDVSKDQFEDLSKSNEEFSSTDDDSFSFDNIDYVEASPPDSELVLFDAKYESDSSEDQSCSDEDVLEKIVSKPLCEEEIIPMKSLRTHDSSLSVPYNIDSVLDEFAGELTILKSIPPGIDKTYCDFEEDVRLIEKLLYDNSSPRPPKEFVSVNSNAESEYFSPSPILVKDSNSLMEEIDLFYTPDYPMPPGIEDKDYDSERDILIRKDLPRNNTLSFAEKESFHFDIPPFSRPPAKPPDGDTGILNIKMIGEISRSFISSGPQSFSAFCYMPDDDSWIEQSSLGCSSVSFLSSLICSKLMPSFNSIFRAFASLGHDLGRNQGNNHGIPQGNNQGRNQFFQGASHGQKPPPAYQAPAYQASGYQAPVHQPLIPQPQVVTTTEFTNYMKANSAILKNMQTNMTLLTNSNLEIKNMFGQFMKMNTASSSGSGTLPSNTITNPKKDLKGITTRSGNAYQGPTIPTTSSLPKAVERETETRRALIDVYTGELTLRVNNEAVTLNLDQTSRYSANYNDMTKNAIDVIDMAREEYSQEVLGFSDVIASGSPTPYYDPIVSTSSLTLTPFGDSNFLLEEVNAFLALEDDPTSPEADHSYYDTEGDILLFEEFLKVDPSLPPPTQGMYLPQIRKEHKICEANNDKSSIDEPTEVELKDLPTHLEYIFLEGDDKFPVLIAKDLSVKKKSTLVNVLKSHKQAIAWKLSDIKGINLEFCTHKILMKDDFELAVQHQRRVNPKNPRGDQKGGAENLATDHLSRLENPHQSVLEKKEINEAFPLETLNMVSFCCDSSTPCITFGKTPACSKFVRINSSGGVFTARKPLTFSRLATMDPPRDTMAQTTPQKRERFRNKMKCLKIPSKFAKFLTFKDQFHGAIPVFTREQVYTRGHRLLVDMGLSESAPHQRRPSC